MAGAPVAYAPVATARSDVTIFVDDAGRIGAVLGDLSRDRVDCSGAEVAVFVASSDIVMQAASEYCAHNPKSWRDVIHESS